MEVNDNFLTTIDDKAAHELVSKLKFISKIKQREKIDVEYLQVISADSWMSSFYRTFITRAESKNGALEFVKSVIKEAFELSYKYLYSDGTYSKNIGKMLINSIIESKTGLANLASTYSYDRLYESEIDAFILFIDTKITDIEKHFPDIKNKIIEK